MNEDKIASALEPISRELFQDRRATEINFERLATSLDGIAAALREIAAATRAAAPLHPHGRA